MRYHLCMPMPRGTDLSECKALPRFTGRTRHSLLVKAFGVPLQTVFGLLLSPSCSKTRSLCAEKTAYFCSSLRFLVDYTVSYVFCQAMALLRPFTFL